MLSKRRVILLVISGLLILFVGPSYASPQADHDPISIGNYRVLPSEILGEDRVLQVHLPRGYENSDGAYPVGYLFYSDWVPGYFAQTVNDLYHLSMDKIPQVILVGIPNTQRYRDLLPWPVEADPETG